MSFENRASRAANGINRSVASLATAVAFVGILGGASVAFAAMLPGQADPDITATETTAAELSTTLPSEPGPLIVVLPANGEDPNGEIPEGAEILILATDDLDSLAGGGWDDWTFGMDGWPRCPELLRCGSTTTTTEPVETTTTEPGVIHITAHQYYGPVTSKPYEKIYGTAPPGTRVLITSEYGVEDGTVGSSGEYYIKVYFSGQPSNEYFPITAKVGSKTYTFQFKWTGSYEVTAGQYYGPENDQRYDKVYGTAPPGTVVIATSEYGSSDMTVGDGGEYYLKIYFNDSLPADQWITWTATLKNPSGDVLLTKTFDFIWVQPAHDITAYQCEYPKVYSNPWQLICGWAPEGSFIDIISDHGSMEKAIGGEYNAKIHFNDSLPANEWIGFTVKIWVEGEVVLEKVFEFKWATSIDTTAFQKWGSCDDPSPYDEFYGSAPAGTAVSVTSAYGSASTTAESSGEWWVKVWFDGAPIGTSFPVTVHVGEETFGFQFTWTYEEPEPEITAHQKWGPESGEPAEKIYGAAPPGTLVSATSEYGSSSMTVGGGGEYSLVISFNNPTPNESFTISVTVGGESFSFSFTHVVT